MMVYVDELITWSSSFGPSCHMMTDGELEELHTMADKIGLKRNWFQNKPGLPHYDLKKGKREMAIRNGAVPTTSKEMLQKCRRRQ